MANGKHKVKLNPCGNTTMEKWYALARRWCSIFNERTKTNDRCKKCFAMRNYPSKGKYVVAPHCGCDGCAEMDRFFSEAKAFFETEFKGKNAQTP